MNRRKWGVGEGILLCAGWGLCGAVLQVCYGEVPWKSMAWPVSSYVLLGYGVCLGVGYAILRHTSWISFLTSCRAAVPALLGVWMMTLLMGLFSQVPDGWAAREAGFLHRIAHSWPFAGLYVWLSILLAGVVLRRGELLWQRRSISVSDVSFCCFHFGLWLVLVAGALGYADEVRLRLPLRAGVIQHKALDDQGKLYELPFGVQQDTLLWEVDVRSESPLPAFVGVELCLHPLRGEVQRESVRVNHPVQLAGWILYVIGYESDVVTSEKTGVLEAVRNPWLPGMQVGIGCLMAGAMGWLVRFPQRKKEGLV